MAGLVGGVGLGKVMSSVLDVLSLRCVRDRWVGYPVDSWVYRSEALEEDQGQKYRFSKNMKVEWKSEGSVGQLDAERCNLS